MGDDGDIVCHGDFGAWNIVWDDPEVGSPTQLAVFTRSHVQAVA